LAKPGVAFGSAMDEAGGGGGAVEWAAVAVVGAAVVQFSRAAVASVGGDVDCCSET
jgi:hypothetical protein